MIVTLGKNRLVKRKLIPGPYWEGKYTPQEVRITDNGKTVHILASRITVDGTGGGGMSLRVPLEWALKEGMVRIEMETEEVSVTRGISVGSDGTVIFAPGEYEKHIIAVLNSYNVILEEDLSRGRNESNSIPVWTIHDIIKGTLRKVEAVVNIFGK